MLTPLSTVVVRIADAIGTADTVDAIYEAALEGVMAVTGVDRASILLFDPDGVMRFKAWAGLSEHYRRAVEGHTPWLAGAAAPDPLVVADVRADPALVAFGPAFAAETIVALAFVPIVSRGRVTGKFMLYRAEPDRFDRGELPAALAIGYQIGFAVERLRSEREAADAHQRMLFALDAAQMGTWEWDLGTNTVKWSENLERIHGLPPGTFTGDFASYAREVHPEDAPRVMASAQGALRDGTLHDVEYRAVAPDGTIRWMHGKGRVETDASGRPLRLTGVCMDIGGRKAVEAEMQSALRKEAELREKLATLTSGAPRLLAAHSTEDVLDEVLSLAQTIVSADGYAIWRLHEGEWRVGASRGLSEAFTAKAVPDSRRFSLDMPIVAEDVNTAPPFEERRAQYAAEGIISITSIPLAIRSAPGSGLVFYHRTPHRPPDNELHVAQALGQLAAAAIDNADLHAEQQRLRQEAQDAEVRAAFLAEASAVLSSLDYERNLQHLAAIAVPRLSDWCAVDLLSDDGQIARLAVTHSDPAKVAWAHEVHRRYPPALDEDSGVGFVVRTGTPQLFSDVSDQLLAAGARDADHLAIVRQLQIRSVMIVPLTTGRRTFGAISFVSTAGGRRFTAVDLDFAVELARRAALAIENARLFQEARDANRVKDEFLATLSHELRTPLNVILGRARRLRDAGLAREALLQNAETIERNAQSLARLVEDLLDVSRFTVGQVTLDMRLADFGAIAQSVVGSLEPTARAKGIALDVEVDPDLPPIAGDPTRLQQVIWNLVTNAVKFTPEGGRVTVTLRQDGSQQVLTVSDTGIGIPADFLPFAFDMFRQAEPAGNRQHGGLGLGLSIVKRLVELHGGTVTAASGGPGAGSSFVVALPSAARAPEAATARHASRQ